MRKLVFLLLMMLAISSCSTDNEKITSNLNPPSWIQGTWLVKGSTNGSVGVRFTDDDIVLIQNFLETSQKKLINQSRDLGQEVLVNEDKSNEYYSVRLDFENGQNVNLSFTKISDSEITWNQVNNSVLIKQ